MSTRLALALALAPLVLPDTATAQEIRKLVASDGVIVDRFGTSIDVDGDTLLVGAPLADYFWQGKAYTFDMQTGKQVYVLKAPDAANSDKFGWVVGITPSFFVVSSPNDTKVQGVTVDVGSLSLFDRASGTSLGKVYASDGTSIDQLGFSEVMLFPRSCGSHFGIMSDTDWTSTGKRLGGSPNIHRKSDGASVLTFSCTDAGGTQMGMTCYIPSPNVHFSWSHTGSTSTVLWLNSSYNSDCNSGNLIDWYVR